MIHHGIDGFSRLVVFSGCSPNNRAETVHLLFRGALPKYGRPLRIGTNHCGENIDIWRNMIAAKGEESKPVLVGKSVHNQRIERHNRALNEQLTSIFREEFYQLESEGVLYVNNDTDIFVFILSIYQESTKPFLNLLLPITTTRCQQKNKTPAQLFWCNIRLADYCQGVLPEHANQPDLGELMASHLPRAVVPETPNPLSEESLGDLQDLVSSLSYTGGMFVYRRVVQFVGQHMLVQK